MFHLSSLIIVYMYRFQFVLDIWKVVRYKRGCTFVVENNKLVHPSDFVSVLITSEIQ